MYVKVLLEPEVQFILASLLEFTYIFVNIYMYILYFCILWYVDLARLRLYLHYHWLIHCDVIMDKKWCHSWLCWCHNWYVHLNVIWHYYVVLRVGCCGMMSYLVVMSYFGRYDVIFYGCYVIFGWYDAIFSCLMQYG